MENSIRVFNGYLTSEKKSSANTVESYMRDVLQFSSFCTGNNIINIAQVTEHVGQLSEELSENENQAKMNLSATDNLETEVRKFII